MKKLAIALSLIASVLVVGCDSQTKETAQVVETPKVQLTIANEICFEVDRELKTAAQAEGLDPNHYHSSECGTAAQQIAFDANNYEIVDANKI